jgi:hypothetical protein
VAALSRRARGAVRSLLESGSLFLAAGIAVAFLLSLGLTMRSHGFAFGPGLFSWLYSHVPGYDGLRVPARFMTEIALFMAALSGIGAARLRSWRPHAARVVVPLAAFLGLAEAATMPLAMNSEIGTDLPRNLPDSLNRGPAPEGIYRDVAALPRDAVIAELPFGDEQCELFYMYASIFHDRRMVNGFSGGAPRRYEDLRETLSNPARNIERAFQALRGAAVTHVIVHEGVWKARIRGRRVTRGLVSRGCRVVGRDGRDVLLAMPRP